jgi:hypothetical protein
MMRKVVLLCILGIAGAWSSLVFAGGPAFSAEVVTINIRDRTERSVGKIYVDNFRQRKEMSIPDKRAIAEYGQTVIQIVNPQRQAMWQIFPEKRKYWEWLGKIPTEQLPLPGDSRHFCAKTKDRGVSCAKLAAESLGDRTTDKWELMITREGRTMKTLVWIDPKLGMPIREESSGVGAMELRNIKEGPQPDSLFEIPADFQKVEPPQGRGPAGSHSGMLPQGVTPQGVPH